MGKEVVQVGYKRAAVASPRGKRAQNPTIYRSIHLARRRKKSFKREGQNAKTAVGKLEEMEWLLSLDPLMRMMERRPGQRARGMEESRRRDQPADQLGIEVDERHRIS